MKSFYWSDPRNLYEVLIEELGLSEESIRRVHRTGITTIGDCIDFFARLPNTVIDVDHEAAQAMFDDVLPLLEKHGYWPRDHTKKV